MNPNGLAWGALYAWPVIVLVVFATRRSSSRLARTTAWMMFLPVMFLPANLDLPFAALNKHRIALLSIGLALVLLHRSEIAVRDKWRHLPLFLLLAFGCGTLLTIRTNADPLTFGILRIPGLGLRDGAWIVYAFFVDLLLPFVIGQRVFRTERDLRDLLEVLSTCALIYVPLCLIEMRLSPQLSNWVYGYFPHSFLQTVRGSGYRPVVFMNHGLSVAMFMFSGFCASVALRRIRTDVWPSPTIRSLVTGMILLLGGSLASIIYALIAFLLSTRFSARVRAWVLVVIAITLMAYPVLRAMDVIPVTEIGDTFRGLSSERSASLMFRFSEEDRLLQRALLRPMFGWGNWGRSRLYISWGEHGDAWAGFKDVSVTDGAWIIWLGTSGFVGFGISIALLTVPLLLHALHRPQRSLSSQSLIGALAVMVALFGIDLLPNAQSDYLPVAYGGALLTLSAVRSRSRVTGRTGSHPIRGADRPPLHAGNDQQRAVDDLH